MFRYRRVRLVRSLFCRTSVVFLCHSIFPVLSIFYRTLSGRVSLYGRCLYRIHNCVTSHPTYLKWFLCSRQVIFFRVYVLFTKFMVVHPDISQLYSLTIVLKRYTAFCMPSLEKAITTWSSLRRVLVFFNFLASFLWKQGILKIDTNSFVLSRLCHFTSVVVVVKNSVQCKRCKSLVIAANNSFQFEQFFV